MTWMLFAVIVMALLFDFVNGWNDSANAIATVVSTPVLSPLVAIIYAAILNFFETLFPNASLKPSAADWLMPRPSRQM